VPKVTKVSETPLAGKLRRHEAATDGLGPMDPGVSHRHLDRERGVAAKSRSRKLTDTLPLNPTNLHHSAREGRERVRTLVLRVHRTTYVALTGATGIVLPNPLNQSPRRLFFQGLGQLFAYSATVAP